MTARRLGLLPIASLALAVLVASTLVPATAGARSPHPQTVERKTLTFVDHRRPADDPTGTRSAPSRTLVTDIYVPSGKGPFPLIVFAHGNAGNPGKLTQMLGAWAAAGYVVVAPTFPLTNDATPGPAIISDYVHQPADVSFVLDRVLHLASTRRSLLYHRVDAHHIGMAGHSLGGETAYGVMFDPCCRDRRFDAVVLMDAVRIPFGKRPFSFRHSTPILLIHIKGDPVVTYQWSAQTYAVAKPPKYLMTLNVGLHFEPFENAPSPHDAAVVAATTAFWDAYLRHEKGATRRIVSGGTEAGLSTVQADTH